ncbi:MAG: nucleotidyl transferase AbiEii/AbiGii toxin family protein [bacterium]|nr:nucleotidyl transferase AbiEii/AbiGii toxin family protein [bacterium]
MLSKDNFSEEHIRELQKQNRRDPILLERTVYAFGLLEAISRVGMPFIFKGGTCLMLLMDQPRRLSTDIDIIVEPGVDVIHYIDEASKIFPFLRVEEQKRKARNSIEKRHFKFTYDSHIGNSELYILLDVLFEEHHYENVVQREIKNALLNTEPEYFKVRMPSAACILGDKFTAFAPHTTGILLGQDKNMEIMKQFYDISSLLDVFDSFDDMRNTYYKVVISEINYRGLNISGDDCLRDTYEAALCIASRGKAFTEDYSVYVKAIQDLRGHIFSENFSPEIAVGRAAKIIYAVACLLKNQEYESVADYVEYMSKKITNQDLMCLKYLRKANPVAYAYVIKADEVMNL